MLFRGLLAVALSLIFGSCTDLNRANRLDQLSVMLNELEEIEVGINKDSFDTTLVLHDLATIHYWAFTINDTIDAKLMYQLDSVRRIKNDLESRNALHRYLKTAVRDCKSRLKELKYDITNDYGARQEYDHHLNHERRYIDSLSNHFGDYSKLDMQFTTTSMDFLARFKDSYNLKDSVTEQLLLD